MHEYDFLILSPPEFENLTRDLLQKELNVFVESFMDGADGGIDLRFTRMRNENVIVQCKRYEKFSSLYQNLKKEVSNVKRLKPSRYIVSTSVGLSPMQKEKISTLFAPYILSQEDIIGKNDLNNLIGKHKSIELKYTKLWLSSVNVLDKILHSKIYNQSQFEIDKIYETIKLYVQNDSFYEASQILKEHHFVIISGIPGIGKTTLARMLTYHLLSIGFEEFVFLSNSIDEGYSLYHEEKKQVFLFDDFLGKNFLERSKPSNEEESIVRFIDKIKESKNKALIFTTREYILNQATSKYELFGRTIFDKTKCIIDLSKYTRIVRAKILYNHIFFSRLPKVYILELFKNKFYLELISHPNYNPRIIEVVIRSKIWESTELLNFRKKFKSFFDYPESIWKHAYDNHISVLSRCILALMFTAGTPILYDDLLLLIQNFAKKFSHKYDISFSEKDYKKSLKELENSFVSTTSDNDNVIAITYQNPSVQDFLVNYLNTELDFINDILEAAIFVNQLFKVFTFHEYLIINKEKVKRKNQIMIKGKLLDVYFNKVINDLDYLNSSRIWKAQSGRSTREKVYRWTKRYFTESEKLVSIINDILLDEHPHFKDFIKTRFLDFVNSDDFELDNEEIDSFINVLRIFKDDIQLDTIPLLEKMTKNFIWYQDLLSFKQMEKIYPKEYQSFIESNEKFRGVLGEVLQVEFDSADENSYGDVILSFKEMEKYFGLDTTYELESIEEKYEELKVKQEQEHEINQDYYKEQYYESRFEDREIENMFESLKTKEE